jgi:hypothetical protein
MILQDYDIKHRAAILYRTHFWDESVEAEILKLYITAGAQYDIWVVAYAEPGVDFAAPAPIRKLICCAHDLRVLGLAASCGCPAEAVPARNLDLALLYFLRLLPDYTHYWLIEYDVRYSGDWSAFFAQFDAAQAGLLGTYIYRLPELPYWPHWGTLCTNGHPLAPAERIKSFTPLIRLTRQAAAVIDQAYRQGWHGHYETLWTTAVAAAGLGIEDIGGQGPFTPAARQGCNYTGALDGPELGQGSFLYRPIKSEAEIIAGPALLWHPIKPAALPPWIAGSAPVLA